MSFRPPGELAQKRTQKRIADENEAYAREQPHERVDNVVYMVEHTFETGLLCDLLVRRTTFYTYHEALRFIKETLVEADPRAVECEMGYRRGSHRMTICKLSILSTTA